MCREASVGANTFSIQVYTSPAVSFYHLSLTIRWDKVLVKQRN